MATISAIIPALNEAAVIERPLRVLSQIPDIEIIVVDGGSHDGTGDLARPYAKVHTAPRGRARQMNFGAHQATGEILLFLHADTLLSSQAINELRKALENPRVVGGAFRLGIDSPKRVLQWIATVTNWRTWLTKIPYGDQGIFVRRSVFMALGGYPDQELMEDIEFSRQLKRAGQVVILREAVQTSSRRWDREGVGFTTLRNQILVLFYFMGVPPHRLVRWYRPIR